jgi:hypothetical protein
MIEAVDARLRDWAAQVVPGTAVTLDAPAADGRADEVAVHLVELADLPPARGPAPPSRQVLLRYLVSAGGEDPLVAHGRLGRLLFAAMEEPDFEVACSAVPAGYWQAAAARPRPAFVLSVPLRLAAEIPEPVLVREPVTLRIGVSSALEGRLVGPGDVPVADAYITLPSLRLSTRSDAAGRFAFAAVPRDPPARLHVSARAREFDFTVDGGSDGPVTLRLDPSEGIPAQ